MKRYRSLIRAGVLDALQFRLSLIVTVVGNLLYLLLVYYIWKAIFASAGTDVVNGMTFTDTMIYLVFANALFQFMEMWVVWSMGDDIRSGAIIKDLLRPIPYSKWTFFSGLGNVVTKFVTTFFPTAVVVFVVADGAIHLGINVLLFVVSVAMSLLINYYINLMVGTICMYTDTIWGINIMKEVIVGLLSGATIPLAFYPDAIQSGVMLLPFQAICNAPLSLLLHPEYSAKQCIEILLFQLFWLLVLKVLSAGFFRISVKQITVNGG